MSSSSDSFYTKSSSEQRSHDVEPNESEGVLANVKQQLNSVTGGRSVSEIGSDVSSVAGEKVQGMKETVVPAAEDAIQTVQTRIQSLTGSIDSSDCNGARQGISSSLSFSSLVTNWLIVIL